MSLAGFAWKNEGQTKALYAKDEVVGTIEPFIHDRIVAEDDLTELEHGLFSWVRHFHVLAPVSNVRLTMEFSVPRQLAYGMIPAVSYNGNPWGSGHDIKGFTLEGQPWTFAYHRTAVAGATYSEYADWSIALFAKEGFEGACALVPAEQQTTHRLVWPEIETPWVYINRDEYGPPYEVILFLEPGATVSIAAYLLFTPVQEPRQAWRRMLDIAWQQHHYSHQPRYSGEDIWRWGIQYAKESLWAEEGMFRGFSIGLQWVNGNWIQSTHAKYQIGWCGQNASLANALLSDYLRTGSQSSLDKGLAALDSWATYARLPNGLFRCRFDHILSDAEATQEVQDGCNLGAAALYFFEAYQLGKQCGIERSIYRDVALNICEFFVAHQFDDGNLGRAWRNDGTCAATDGTTGGFLIPPLLTAYQVKGDPSYLQAAERAYRYYVRGLLEEGFTTAGALDTHCIDKESSIPLLQAGLMLYEISGDPVYLRWAERAASYLASWQWHHTVSYPPGTALNELDYDTFGGTSVSTQHHHQDPYALSFVLSWIKLAELTGNSIWKQRAQAVWANGMIGISAGDLTVMGKERPVGSQDEGFYHTRWGHLPFNTSQWLVAWPTAFRLEVLRSLPDWSILDPPAS